MVMKPRFERGRRDRLETLHPAYFALVMATGIVAIAAHLHGVPWLPSILFWVNVVFLAGLTAANVARAVRHRRAFAADVRSHSRGVGFFTAVAALAVFGKQLVLQQHAMGLAAIFWLVAFALLMVVTYGILAVLTIQPHKPDLADGLNGGWLVAVVAPQSVATFTVLLLSTGAFVSYRETLMFAALCLWLIGGVLYMWLMTLIFLRYTFVRMSPEDLTPPYWISMGAVAISTLAGATLLEHAALSPLVVELATFIKGITLLFWAVGSWWIPMLVLLGIWRYLVRGVVFAYDPLYWGGVFPLGMYSVCTYRVAEFIDLPFLMPLSSTFMVIAIVAWTAALVGLVDSRRRSADVA